MYQDTEQIANDLEQFYGNVFEVNWQIFKPMFARAEPGWTPFEEPDNYRWFVIEDFPVKKLDVTLKRMMKDARDPGQEKFQHDRIIEKWKKGAPFWPVFVSATGVISDGYHRTAAHRTLGHKTTDVVVSVAKHVKGAYPGFWDDLWHDRFPKGKGS